MPTISSGLTTLSVATYGIQDPSDVWKTGLNRALEILVGSLISLVVTSILWPRHAREEFFAIGSQALETAAEIVTLETASFLQVQDSTGRLEQLQKKFEQQASNAAEFASSRSPGKHALLWTARQLQRIRSFADQSFSSRSAPREKATRRVTVYC